MRAAQGQATLYDSKPGKISFCDRMLLGPKSIINDMRLEGRFQVAAYDSMSDLYIEYSDHDLVYALFTFDGMNILSVTFNAGDLAQKTPSRPSWGEKHVWRSIIKTLKSLLAEDWSSIDLFFFGLQEMKKTFQDHHQFKELYESLLEGQSHSTAAWTELIQSTHSKKRLVTESFDIYLYVLFNSDVIEHDKSQHDTISFGVSANLLGRKGESTLFGTKAAHFVGKFKRRGQSDAKSLTLSTAHFPIEKWTKKDQTFGNKGRLRALEEVQKHYGKGSVDRASDALLLLGDLNFRQLDAQDPNTEQLDTFLWQRITQITWRTQFWVEIAD